jgi:hypothetical protein
MQIIKTLAIAVTFASSLAFAQDTTGTTGTSNTDQSGGTITDQNREDRRSDPGTLDNTTDPSLGNRSREKRDLRREDRNNRNQRSRDQQNRQYQQNSGQDSDSNRKTR